MNYDLLDTLRKTYVDRISIQLLQVTTFIRQQFLDMYAAIKVRMLQFLKDKAGTSRREVSATIADVAHI
ncbi:hypothetical protein A4A49_13833 [Nicotiana attenuata]|uniref:Uncharacterized protein n=1 Tax=Nicotiana attenuata TaxID=49451 RepID=A0A314KMS9_NICAT|nr:hypothetical protein A4A49_13833 [Nicotiana attenuata]